MGRMGMQGSQKAGRSQNRRLRVSGPLLTKIKQDILNRFSGEGYSLPRSNARRMLCRRSLGLAGEGGD